MTAKFDGLARILFDAAAQRSGVETWSVKTGTDADTYIIDLGNQQVTTIAQVVLDGDML